MGTANGEVSADYVVRYEVPQLGGDIWPFLLEFTPDVISIGRRCVRDGWAFHWPAYSYHPYLVSPTGEVIRCVVIHDVPYIVDFRNRANESLTRRVRDMMQLLGRPAEAGAPARARSTSPGP